MQGMAEAEEPWLGGKCSKCKEDIGGTLSVAALGRTWHKRCFTSVNLSCCSLPDFALFKTYISNEMSQIIKQPSHVFDRCWECGLELGEFAYEFNSRPYCYEDYTRLSASRCVACDTPIHGNMMVR